MFAISKANLNPLKAISDIFSCQPKAVSPVEAFKLTREKILSNVGGGLRQPEFDRLILPKGTRE